MLAQPLLQHPAEPVSEVLQDLSFFPAAQGQWVPPEGAQGLLKHEARAAPPAGRLVAPLGEPAHEERVRALGQRALPAQADRRRHEPRRPRGGAAARSVAGFEHLAGVGTEGGNLCSHVAQPDRRLPPPSPPPRGPQWPEPSAAAATSRLGVPARPRSAFLAPDFFLFCSKRECSLTSGHYYGAKTLGIFLGSYTSALQG